MEITVRIVDTMVEVAGKRMLRIRRPWLPFRSPADTSLLDSPPDCLAELGPSQGSIPYYIIMNTKKGLLALFCVHGGTIDTIL